MRQTLALQDIEELRRQEGIDDVELRLEIRALKAGDIVKVSVLTATMAFETVAVRITSVRGSTFRGRLVRTGRRKMPAAPIFAFSTSHIHSIPKKEAHP